jgi:hypothetical protein
MAQTIKNGQDIRAKVDAGGTDVGIEVNGDEVTVATGADDYKSIVTPAWIPITTPTIWTPGAGLAWILDNIKITNTSAFTRTITFYKGGTTAQFQWGTPIQLAAGESAEWTSVGWVMYNLLGDPVVSAGAHEHTTASGMPLTSDEHVTYQQHVALATPGAGATNRVRTYANLYNRMEQVDSTGLHQSMLSPYLLNVKDFNAKGDDSTDDLAAINAAIAYGVANYATFGWTLYFPSGVYRVSGAITFASSKIEVIGAGRGSTKIRNTDANLTSDILVFGAQSEVTIRDISIWSNVNRTAGSGILLNGTSSISITRMFIWNMFIGINMQSPSQLVTISDMTIHGPNTAGCYGINLDSDAFGDINIGPNVVISQINASQGTGININATLYVTMNIVDIVGWKNALVMNPPAGKTLSWCFFNSCLFDTSGERGVIIYSSGATAILRGMFFNNCWFATSGVTGGGSGLGDGLYIDTGAGGVVDDIRLVGCRSLNNKLHGVYVGALCTNINITDSTIVGNSTQTANTYDGIRLAANASQFSITNNRIGGAYGIFLNQQQYSVNLLAGTSNNYTITNNDCSGNTTANSTGTIFDGGATSTFGQKFITANLGHAIKGKMDAIVAATAGLNTTETVIIGGLAKAVIPKNSLTVGDQFKIRIWGTTTATVANVTTIRIRIGTAGTTGDGAVMTITLPASAAAGTTIPFDIEAVMTIRTTGGSASVHGTAVIRNQSVTSNATASTGIMIFATQVIIPTFATFASNVANYIEVTHVTAATTTTNTIQGGFLEWL